MKRSNPVNDSIRNFARGGSHYRELRLKIAETVVARKDIVEMLPDFLGKELFDLDNRTWVNLALTDKDWPFITKLRSASGKRFDHSYLNLTLSYIVANAKRVTELYNKEAKISELLIKSNLDGADAERQQLDEKDQQSLFSYRLTCALHHLQKDDLISYFSAVQYSAWTRKRFLYPFIYFFINRPADEFLDHHLSQVLPPGYENQQERAVIEFLLRDELAYEASLSFKCYVGLTAHPYDACEILLNHCEADYCRNGRLGQLEQLAVTMLTDIVPASRRVMLPALFGKEEDVTSLRDDCDPDPNSSIPNAALKPYIRSLLGNTPLSADPETDLGKVILAAIRVRHARYPTVRDYDLVVTFARAYWFTAAGRFLGAFLTALFLLPRREKTYELREALRLVGICGGVTPLIATAPRVYLHLNDRMPPCDFALLKAHVELLGSLPSRREDRLWFNQIHFELSALEHSGHFKIWLQKVFDSLPVMPLYLTGIDWSWFAGVLEFVRIGPFYGSPAGIYSLLLQHVEGRKKDTNYLRFAIEPVAKKTGTLEAFLDWAFEEFADKAVALIRYCLVPDMLLWLRLESNYVAALSSRMRAIETCARKFGLGALLTEEVIIQERKAYTAALLAINVGANQFEISWEILKKDVALSQGDVYNAYLTFRGEEKSQALLTSAKFDADYTFAIGQTAKYQIVNSDWPLFNVIVGMIDIFMEHPSQGIESILAIRIRHNSLRREYLAAVAQVRRSNIPGVTGSDRQYIVPKFDASIGRAIQAWVDMYMHQKRHAKPMAAFDFVPDQRDMEHLIEQCREHSDFGQTFDIVSRWIKTRLNLQLQNARSLLSKNLRSSIDGEVKAQIAAIQRDEPHIHSVADIGLALLAALNQQTDKLAEWFAMPTTVGSNVAIADLHLAVSERFQSEIETGALSLGRPSSNFEVVVAKEHVRMVYDLWCEAIVNVSAHSNIKKSLVRIGRFADGKYTGLVFSSTRKGTDVDQRDVAGHPYTSIHDSLFREGESGLPKIASLSASIVGSSVVVRALKRRGYFHLIVPISCCQTSESAT
jgi:hypothetical protein